MLEPVGKLSWKPDSFLTAQSQLTAILTPTWAAPSTTVLLSELRRAFPVLLFLRCTLKKQAITPELILIKVKSSSCLAEKNHSPHRRLLRNSCSSETQSRSSVARKTLNNSPFHSLWSLRHVSKVHQRMGWHISRLHNDPSSLSLSGNLGTALTDDTSYTQVKTTGWQIHADRFLCRSLWTDCLLLEML